MFYNKFLRYLILFFTIFYSNIASSNNKIYYIDIDFLMNSSLAGKSIIKQLAEKNQSNQKKFQEIENNLKNEEMKIISQKNILNEQEYLKKVELFTKKVSDYKLSRTNTVKNISQMKNNAQKTLTDSLTTILAEYAEKNSILYIIPKQSIIIGKTELNLTEIIAKILDSKIKNINLK